MITLQATARVQQQSPIAKAALLPGQRNDFAAPNRLSATDRVSKTRRLYSLEIQSRTFLRKLLLFP